MASIIGILIFSSLLVCALIIGFIYHQNKKAREQNLQKSREESLLKEKRELELVNKARQEKLRKEKEREETIDIQTRLSDELKPILEKFIFDNDFYQWKDIIQEAEMILQGQPITIQELLRHNVIRKFNDGTVYKVGIVKKVEDIDYSLPPEKVVALQNYFLCFLDFYSQLSSKGINIDKLILHKLVENELNKYTKKARSSML